MEKELLTLTRKILSYADLEKSWDSYGAVPITLNAVRNTFDLCEYLMYSFEYMYMYPIHVAPLSYGGIQLEFITPKGSLEVEIFNESDKYHYLMIRNEIDGYEEDENVDRIKILNLISELYG